MHMQRSLRVTSAALMVITMTFAGCLGGGSEGNSGSDIPDWAKGMEYVDLPSSHSDSCFSTPCVRPFDVGDPNSNTTWGNSSWVVFGNEEGGNCCEHYLAATKEGWILNFGG
ncbi:MAG TPA: hypothetical protein QF525_03615, partial [Candidatus Thalassarchaeaceae archaeon]|nr:hypothetical protein [Candidatus Thalassarchaeaceae archaeon]